MPKGSFGWNKGPKWPSQDQGLHRMFRRTRDETGLRKFREKSSRPRNRYCATSAKKADALRLDVNNLREWWLSGPAYSEFQSEFEARFARRSPPIHSTLSRPSSLTIRSISGRGRPYAQEYIQHSFLFSSQRVS